MQMFELKLMDGTTFKVTCYSIELDRLIIVLGNSLRRWKTIKE